MNNPLVSISCITYNHAPFIRQCLDGFLMQQCDFEYEILIHDDASTDGTSDIIREYQKKYPEIIKPIIQKENQWSQGVRGINIKFNFSRAKGKYIALCEGDDYWTDPLKLQKQVSFLEANPEYSFCVHNNYTLNAHTGEQNIRNTKEVESIIDLNSIIIKKKFATASIIFRKSGLPKFFPEWYSKVSNGDYALVVLLAEKGLGKYFSDIMSVYRVHEKGVWSSKDSEYITLENIKFLKILLSHFSDFEIQKIIKTRLNQRYQNYGLIQIRKGFIFKGFVFWIKHLFSTRNPKFKLPYRKIPGALKVGVKHISKR